MQQCRLIRHRQLCGVGGRCGPQVGNIVRNGHIRLMPHGGNNGYIRIVDGMGHPLVVKGPQILHGAAAPAHDQQVGQMIMIGVANGGGDLPRRFHPLHPHGKQPHLRQRVSLVQNSEHIMDGGSGGAGDDADGSRIRRQRLLMLRGKKPLGGQLLFQLLKGGVQIPHPVHGQAAAIELKRAVSGVDGDPPHGNDFHAVFRAEAKPGGVGLEHDAF